MAAVFLVTLFEYSPLFYITVVSTCFIVTATLLLGWVGFDVPVILRSSDETESVLPTPEKQMVRVTNPFALELGRSTASIIDGARVRLKCLEPCVLSCFWGCEVVALQAALHTHQESLRLSTPQLFQEALHQHYHHCQTFHVNSEDSSEYLTQIPADQGITDFGPMPRDRYPLVAVLTLSEPETRDTYNIVSSVTVVHVPDHKYVLPARVLFQYLLTSQGSMYELKPLFMSADSGGFPGPPDAEHDPAPRDTTEEAYSVGQRGEVDWSEGSGRDCVVCQNARVNRVLLPCRHTCVCDGCMVHFQHCPICRAFVQESFALRQEDRRRECPAPN